MLLNRLIAALVAFALLVAPVHAQVSPGSQPLTGAKGGTGNGFMQFTGPATSLKTYTLPNASETLAALGQIQTWTGAQSFADGKLILLGSSSGAGTLKAPAAASSYIWVLPAASGTLVDLALAQTLTNKTINCANQASCVVRIGTDVSGLGTGIATALAVNVGSAGAPVVFNGAGGTPSSLILTNATGLPTTGLVNNSVTNAKLDQMANARVKCRTTAGTGDPEDCTATQTTALLNAVVGDSGSGGTKGLVPAPGAGDAAAGKYLKADGTFAVPPGSGGGGLTDVQRQNFLLNAIYQSKTFAAPRRTVLEYADGYKASSGVAAGSSSNYTVDTTNGFVAATATDISGGTGTNIGDMTASGGLAAAFNGTTSESSTNSARRNSVNNAYVGKNYSSAPKRIVAAKVYGSNNVGYFVAGTGSVTLTMYGKNGGAPSSGTDGTVIGTSTFTDTTSGPQTVTSTDAGTLWDYAWIYLTGATGDDYLVAELIFQESANMTVVSTAQTADSSVSSARVLLEFDNVASPTLNTDLTIEVTCNGGSNWATATASSVTVNSQSGRKVVETADTACTSGTSFQHRIKNLNNKYVPVYGATITVH